MNVRKYINPMLLDVVPQPSGGDNPPGHTLDQGGGDQGTKSILDVADYIPGSGKNVEETLITDAFGN